MLLLSLLLTNDGLASFQVLYQKVLTDPLRWDNYRKAMKLGGQGCLFSSASLGISFLLPPHCLPRPALTAFLRVRQEAGVGSWGRGTQEGEWVGAFQSSAGRPQLLFRAFVTFLVTLFSRAEQL